MLDLNKKNIIDLLKNMTKEDEFEVMFNNYSKTNTLTFSHFKIIPRTFQYIFLKHLENIDSLTLCEKYRLGPIK